MLRLMLNNHGQICVPHESGFITECYWRLADFGDLAVRENAGRLLDDIGKIPFVASGRLITDKDRILAHPTATYSDLIRAIYMEYAKTCGKTRWGDKTPEYTPDLDILYNLFPGCQILHIVRDGRDVAVSQRDIRWLSDSIPRLAEDWRWKTTIAHKVGSVMGDQFLEIHYEDLVLDTEATLGQVCDFLGEDFDEGMMAFSETAEGAVPDESLQWHRNSIRPPDPRKIGAWKSKLSRADRTIYEQIAGPALELFGYEREYLPSSLASRARALYFAVIKRW